MRNVFPAAAAALLLLAAPAFAVDTETACWNRDVERIDYYANPPERGDNNFFTLVSSRSSNTNVSLVYPDKASMKQFPLRLYRIRKENKADAPLTTGCDSAYFDKQTYFMPSNAPAPAGAAGLQGSYKSTNTYPDPGPTYAGVKKSDQLPDGMSTSVADKNNVFGYLQWPAGKVATTSAGTDYITACTNVAGAKVSDCLKCIQEKGYWLNPSVADNNVSASAGLFSINYLRFHPPKWTLLALAYKRLVNGPLLKELRNAVIVANGTTGGKVQQKMLPDSCQGKGDPQQKIASIDSLTYTSTANPLAEMLFNTAWYMAGSPSPWSYGASEATESFAADPAGTFDSAVEAGAVMTTGKSEPCTNCLGDFVVLFSDGRGDTANAKCMKDASGNLAAHCTAEAKCNELGMGTEADGKDFLDPAISGGAGDLITKSGRREQPGGTCDMDFADDVAGWMRRTPVLGSKGGSKITTYVVAIGDEANTYGELTTLKEIALKGKGSIVYAENFTQLEKGIDDVLRTIISRATSFSAAAITSVQTRGYTSAFIPRFEPADGSQWSGSLSRFQLFNEFAEGCTSADYGEKNERNPNGNDSCTDLYLRDKNKDFIGEDDSGRFRVLDSSGTWSTATGWPAKKDAENKDIPAVPVWEASDELKTRVQAVIGNDATKARKIFTVEPDGKTGKYTPTLLDFTEANATKISSMLQLGGYLGALCQELSSYTRNLYERDEDCAKDVIRFVHGHDVMRQNPENRKTPLPDPLKPRPKILGDIFHSTPVLVTPPAPSFLCDLGIVNQCVPSLYSKTLSKSGEAAYKGFFEDHKSRKQFVLVAANDGMLHAFSADGGTENLGTGEELWAFIPPETLPRLIRYMTGHRHDLLVDGTPMVRDIWVDGSGTIKTGIDYEKQKDEFHTVAIVGKREGGRSYFALDVTNPDEPVYLWSAPLPGTSEELRSGESWNDLGPAAPPIGPIAEKVADTETSAPLVGTSRIKERYVVALGGGFDSAFVRGRSIRVLDAWTGATVYRYSHADAGGADANGNPDPRKELFPVAAPVSLVDRDGDQLFDMAVVGDTAGQVWTVNMSAPGVASGGLYTNWYAGRAFVQHKSDKFYKRSPFFQRAVVALLPNKELRVFIGAGDRDNIKETGGGTCSLSNLGACMRKNCSVTVTPSRYRVGSSTGGSTDGHYVSGSWSYTRDGAAPASSLTYSTTHAQQAMCSDVADVNIDFDVSCGATSPVTLVKETDLYCDWGATSASQCPRDAGRPLNQTLAVTATVEKSRFYSFKLFGTGDRDVFTSEEASRKYDVAALSDADLNDLTANTNPSAPGHNGWYVTHDRSMDEKTASSALLLGGCVLWNTLDPNTTAPSACTTTLPKDTAYMYQADAITGQIQCGTVGSATYTTDLRYTSRTTYVAPQQPSPVVSVNPATGEIIYSGASIEPGSPPISVTVGSGSIMGPIHWLEVPRSVHECRHGGVCNN